TQQLAGNILSRSGWFIGFLILDIVIVIGILGDPILKEAWNFIIPYSYSKEAHYNGLAVGTLIVLVNLVVSIIAGLYFANRATPAVGLHFALKMIVIGTLV